MATEALGCAWHLHARARQPSRWSLLLGACPTQRRRRVQRRLRLRCSGEVCARDELCWPRRGPARHARRGRSPAADASATTCARARRISTSGLRRQRQRRRSASRRCRAHGQFIVDKLPMPVHARSSSASSENGASRSDRSRPIERRRPIGSALDPRSRRRGPAVGMVRAVATASMSTPDTKRIEPEDPSSRRDDGRRACARCTARCSRSAASRRRRRRPTRRARSAASSTSIIGQEAVCVGAIAALEPEDYVVTTYREHGHAYAKGVRARADPGRALRQEDRLREGPRRLDAHLRQERRTSSAATASSAATSRSPPAPRSRRSTAATAAVTLCFFGEGASTIGGFHEGLALAALWKLPIVFICENNEYSMGTPLYRSLAVEDVSMRALAHGMARDRFDGDDVVKVKRRIAEAVERARDHRRADARRGRHLPLPRPLDERPRPVPHQGRGRGAEAARSAHRSRASACSSSACPRPSSRRSRTTSRPRSRTR